MQKSNDYYEAFVLNADEDIDDFFAEFNISSTDTNGIIPKQFEKTAEENLYECFLKFLSSLKIEFPTTLELATQALIVIAMPFQ